MSSHSVKAARSVLWMVCGAAALAAFGAQAANGQEGAAHSSARSVVVNYQDLDLSKRADAAVLYARLRSAADTVCGDYDIRDYRRTHSHAACMEQALSTAVAHVDNSAVTALHVADERFRVARHGVDGGSRS